MTIAHERRGRKRLEYRRSIDLQHSAAQTFEPLLHLGGRHGWYYLSGLWALRATLDRWIGGPGAAQRRKERLELHDEVGMFRVARLQPPHELLLEGLMRVPGTAWLRFDVAERSATTSRLSITATLETGSWAGHGYWAVLYLVHAFLFRGMLDRLARAAEDADLQASVTSATTAARPSYQPDIGEKRSPCMVGCPSGIDVRGWITTIAQRRALGLTDAEALERAWRTIADVNPFPATTGRICPHPCESDCNRSDKDGAVSIKELERFIGDWAIEHGLGLKALDVDPKPETIGVIGSGPAGLSFAYQLARRGYDVTVYERLPTAGGMLRYGIPAYRLPAGVVDAEVGRILDLGVTLKTGVRIGYDVSLESLQLAHDVVFLGIGAAEGRPLGIPGERGPGVMSATDYLEDVRRNRDPPLGERVVVIGGGDVAMDAARMARRRGAQVTIVYRRSRDEMSAGDHEVAEAMLEGVSFEFLVAPIRVDRDDETVRTVTLRRMRLGELDASGRRRPEPIDGTDFALPVTSVLCAVARTPRWLGLGLDRDAVEALVSTGSTGPAETDLCGGGDVLAPSIATVAIANGRSAAESVHARLRGRERPRGERDVPVVRNELRPEDYPARARSIATTRDVTTWLAEPDEEIHLGIDETTFFAEAERCLSCGSCFGCERCLMYCAHDCFSRLDEIAPGAYFAVALDACRSCGKCVDLCPCGHLSSVADTGT